MHEHVGDRLPPMEERRSGIEESECLIHEVLLQQSHKHDYHIDDDNVLNGSRHSRKKSSPASVIIRIVTHFQNFLSISSIGIRDITLRPVLVNSGFSDAKSLSINLCAST